MSLDRQRPGPQFLDRSAVLALCKISPDICLQPSSPGTSSNHHTLSHTSYPLPYYQHALSCNNTPSHRIYLSVVSRKEYLALVASVPFVACVHGGGLDPSPKAWEALLVGTIPIIGINILQYAPLPLSLYPPTYHKSTRSSPLHIITLPQSIPPHRFPERSTVDDAYRHLPVAIVDHWSDLFHNDDNNSSNYSNNNVIDNTTAILNANYSTDGHGQGLGQAQGQGLGRVRGRALLDKWIDQLAPWYDPSLPLLFVNKYMYILMVLTYAH